MNPLKQAVEKVAAEKGIPVTEVWKALAEYS